LFGRIDSIAQYYFGFSILDRGENQNAVIAECTADPPVIEQFLTKRSMIYSIGSVNHDNGHLATNGLEDLFTDLVDVTHFLLVERVGQVYDPAFGPRSRDVERSDFADTIIDRTFRRLRLCAIDSKFDTSILLSRC